MEEMKDLPALAYTNAREKIAEKFHMSQELLSILNSRQEFGNAGDRIMVANVASSDLPKKAGRIEVDKSTQMLRVFGRDQELLAVYPATAGSAEKPAPSGRLKVTAVSRNPTYRYNPAYAFKGRACEQAVYDQARAEQSGRDCLDRTIERRLRHPWDA
jgi:L,D-transpeptidase catalytic domain